ncbi:MAG: glycosyltransferase [Fervidobacterium sp.]
MYNKYKVSILVPAMDHLLLKYLLHSLSKQTVRPYEVIIIFKGTNSKRVEEYAKNTHKCIVIEQTKGYFTHALNLGKKEVTGDIAVFTDEDAIPFPHWIERYIKLHQTYRDNIVCISSRDLYVDLKTMRTKPTPDDALHVKFFRWFVRPWLERPHPLLKKYRFGVYLTQSYKVAHGPFIPSKPCYSLPFRGVNMSFKREALDEIKFPEHPSLKKAHGNEQYVGLQLIVKGYESVYVPDNPIQHIIRKSLSRIKDKEIKIELRIMESLYSKLINDYAKSNKGAHYETC